MFIRTVINPIQISENDDMMSQLVLTKSYRDDEKITTE